MSARILLVDDDPLILEGFSIYFSETSEFTVVGSVTKGVDALHWLDQHKCDIVVSDIYMPDMDGLELLTNVQKLVFPPKFVGMTAFDSDATMFRLLAQGAVGYIIKGQKPADIKLALREVLHGGLFLSSQCTERLVARSVRNHRALTQQKADVFLTCEESTIVSLIREGALTSHIARELRYAEITVKRKIAKLMERVGACSRTELVYLTQFSVEEKFSS